MGLIPWEFWVFIALPTFVMWFLVFLYYLGVIGEKEDGTS